ncbi:hypothetical protein C1645_831457 [Glomus cerebriforme]|uniref:Crinkler family protein n=1 Tax=Glomus cerebriforme TaxID=658196 RepID=A0A397SLL5_9GLOM|nr:hypothetical protein C1645_831457 [Glomus cerebriforme]
MEKVYEELDPTDKLSTNIFQSGSIIIVQPPSSPATTESPSKRRKLDELGEDSIKLQKVWNTFKNTPDENFGVPFLQFSEDVSYLFGKDDQSNNITTLFIRKIYRHLSKIIERTGTRHFIIIGNPGIGKTFFGYYLLYKLAQQNKTVIYHKHDMLPILFSNNTSYSGKKIYEFKNILANDDVWYIVDGSKPMNFTAKTILISSPQKNNYKEFAKIGTTFQYMSVWSWEETDTCRAVLFPELTQDFVRELYDRWGGIPRFTLFYALNRSQQCLLDKEINSVNETIFNFIGESADDNCAIHKIIHIYTNEPQEEGEETEEIEDDPSSSKTPAVTEFYTMSILKFASDYVSEKVMDILIKNFKDHLLNFVRASSAIGDYGTLRGTIFERLAHRKLLKGGSFKVRPLIKNTATESIELQIPDREKLVFSNIGEIKPNMYCIPIQQNHKSFDACVSPDTFFQMTIAKSHPIVKSGLDKYINKDNNSEIKFYFVLPKELYNSYGEQDLHTAKKIVYRRKFNRLKQYALEFDLKL